MSSFLRSTGIVALSTLMSRILGFTRDMLLANYFGASRVTDAFFVAFRIPNMLRRFVAEGTLTISFVPVYTDYYVNRGNDDANELAAKTLSLQMIVISIIVALGIIFSPQIIAVIGYGFKSSEVIDLAVTLNRFMFPYVYFAGFVAFSMGVLNSRGYFFAPAFSPVLLNVGMITGIVFFSRFFQEPVYGIAAGVIAGGILQLLIQLPYLVKVGFKMKFAVDLKHPGMRKIFRLVGPAIMGNGITQINVLIGTVFASMLLPGSISFIYYADRLTEIVLGVFIISIGNVILPELSKLSSLKDNDALGRTYVSAVRAALFLSIPAAAALMAVGVPIVSVLFMRNEFTFESVRMTYLALFYASLGVPFIAMLRITTPAFYSVQDSRTPVRGAVIALLAYIVFGYGLMHTSLKHAGLTLALSISVALQVTYLMIRFYGKIRYSILKIAKSFAVNALSSAVMAAVVYGISLYCDWHNDPFIRRLLFLTLIIVSGSAVYFMMSVLLKVEELKFILNKVRRILKK